MVSYTLMVPKDPFLRTTTIIVVPIIEYFETRFSLQRIYPTIIKISDVNKFASEVKISDTRYKCTYMTKFG